MSRQKRFSGSSKRKAQTNKQKQTKTNKQANRKPLIFYFPAECINRSVSAEDFLEVSIGQKDRALQALSSAFVRK